MRLIRSFDSGAIPTGRVPRATGFSDSVSLVFILERTHVSQSADADASFFDLLDADTYTRLLAAPRRLGDEVPAGYRGWVVLDEIQRLPDLLNEVHRLIEARRLRFVLTGSSARKLRRKGVNLLAGRALTRFMHPLTAIELGRDFDLRRALRYGGLRLEDPREGQRRRAARHASQHAPLPDAEARNYAARAARVGKARACRTGRFGPRSVYNASPFCSLPLQ